MHKSFSGTFNVQVETLVAPSAKHMCREVDYNWVKDLKASLLKSPTAFVTTVPVMVDVSKENFSGENIESYRLFYKVVCII